jgi:hypothetical protein
MVQLPVHRTPSSARGRLLQFLALGVVLTALAQGPPNQGSRPEFGAQQSRNPNMNHLFARFWADKPVSPLEPSRPIRPAEKLPLLPRAAPTGVASVSQLFVDAERNSRLATKLGPMLEDRVRKWKVHWLADTSEYMRPFALLHLSQRTVLYGDSDWQLFDAGGRTVRNGPLGASGVALDPERQVFYAADQFGTIAARRLLDGDPTFSVALHQGTKFARRYIAPSGRLLVTSSFEIPVDAHEPDPEYSIVETTDLGEPQDVKRWDEDHGPPVIQDLVCKTMFMLATLHGGSIVLALRNGVYVLDLNLEIRRALTGTFSPVELSLDEAGRIYLILQSGSGTALWLVTPEGERLYSFQLPPGISDVSSPPIVGYDHTVYLLAGQHILAVAPDGKLDWSKPAAGTIAGAVVTADDQLLVSEGNAVTAWSRESERRVLYTFPEALSTPPVLTETGDLLVASQLHLYCLTREAEAATGKGERR